VLPASVSADPARRHRFEHEARATGLLNHPNILAVHDAGDHEGAPYLVTELLEGETLRERPGLAPLSCCHEATAGSIKTARVSSVEVTSSATAS
jgi:serine/threonine-protein kinase